MGYHASIVKLIQTYVSWLESIKIIEFESDEEIKYDMRLWTQLDLTRFARSGNTYGFFELLAGIANAAIKKDKGLYTKDAVHAQNALICLKPAICEEWILFYKMICIAFKETTEIRHFYRRFNIDLEKELQRLKWQKARLTLK